ncbi:DUF4276 family protein [Cellulomonas sp. PSBB021]|uniref:DUF4276 family protein n=1 Tax=Cellulomonas sp. PSBB021 TaxID=2003551 RepID=UPI000B8D747F|nr:DUF4276 family protein [Cellulomonas sp. PSBB021]ASR56126.1 hypothetical protein CBP52_14630 [Cellulomonas sp. PSBB021]
MSGVVIASVVEGHGEVQGLPVLLRRIAAERHDCNALVSKPHRVPRGKMTHRPTELQAAVRLQAARLPDGGVLLVLADSDDDEPAQLADDLKQTVDGAAVGARVAVAVAVKEYEAWFLAGVQSLRSHRSVLDDAAYAGDPELPRSPKDKLAALMVEPYGSVRHQPAFNALLDIDAAAERSPSFRRFLGAIDAAIADALRA